MTLPSSPFKSLPSSELKALHSFLSKKIKSYKKLFAAFEARGARPVFVGGVVRDYFLKQETSDVDVEVYDIEQKDLEGILADIGGFSYVGRAYGVYTTGELEIALPRLERKTGQKHQDFDVQLSPFLEFKEAAARRDLTINAMGYDWFSESFLDPYQGRQDLLEKRLKAVSAETFPEDDLRALRVAAFISRFGFVPDKHLFSLCAQANLTHLSPERIGGELKKLFFQGKFPEKGLLFLKETGLAQQLFFKTYSLAAFDSVARDIQFCVEKKSAYKKELVLAILLFYGQPADLTQHFIDLGFEKKLCQKAGWLSYALISLMVLESLEKHLILESFYQLAQKKIDVKAFLDFLDVLSFEKSHRLKEAIKKWKVDGPILPLVEATDLMKKGIKPGVKLGALLARCREIQYQKGLNSKKEVIDLVLRENPSRATS